MVSLESLTPNKNNFYRSSDKDRIAMAASAKENGIKVPVILKADKEKPGRYIIISGHLRVEGARIAGLKEIPAIINEYETEEDELNALLLGNEYRTKTKREIATEMALRKRIWSKKSGERSDLYSKDGEVAKSTRERLAERYKMSESNVDKYDAIFTKRPSLFDEIDRDEMSIDGAYNLLKYLDENDLANLDDREMWPTVVGRISPHLLVRVNENKMPLEVAFHAAVKTLSKLKRPKVRKESEEGSSELNTPAEKAAKPATPKKKEKRKAPEDSFPTHRCEVPECPCYGQLVQVAEEEVGEEKTTPTQANV